MADFKDLNLVGFISSVIYSSFLWANHLQVDKHDYGVYEHVEVQDTKTTQVLFSNLYHFLPSEKKATRASSLNRSALYPYRIS